MSFPKNSSRKKFQNHRLVTQPSAKRSITAKTLLQITLTIGIVTVVSSFVSYLKVVSTLKSQALEQLEKYVVERGEREQDIFQLAEDNHAVFKQELLTRLQKAGNQDPKQEFEQLFVKQKDGVIRNRPEKFDGKTQVGVYIGKAVNVTPEIRRRVKILHDISGSFGTAWHNRFQDVYFTAPENMIIVYWPEVPTWVQDAKADLDLTKEEYYVAANKQNNPERKSIWTGFFYDTVSKLGMVSCETPVDFNGQDLGIIGQDILINELQERIVNNHIKDGYNMLFRADGHLIAHPKLMDKIKEKGGTFNILDSGDQELKEIYQSVKNMPSNQVIIDNSEQDNFIGVTKLQGPGWYFVTVLPKSTLTQKAIEAAWFILLFGLIGLVIIFTVVFLILRQQIATPLKDLIWASNQIAAGDFNISIENKTQDELGMLADSFNLMAKEVETRTRALQKALQQQAASVYQTKVTMDELNISSLNSAEQAEAATAGAKQVISLVNGGNSDMNRVVSLRDKMGQLTEQVFYLSEQSRQIGTISTLVSELANQTNMLAINAAVEAVRAGENGKGFAVVASEIRRLADQSKKSAEQINALVTDIQKSTNSTLVVNEEGRKTVETVVQAINNMLTNSQEISSNAQQQAVAIAQVVEAMNALNQIALQNSSIMDNS